MLSWLQNLFHLERRYSVWREDVSLITHIEVSSEYSEELCDMSSRFNSSLEIDFGKQ